MDWNLALAVIINLVSIAMAAATLWTKVTVLERDVMKLEKEVIDFRSLKEDIAIVKEQLRNISDNLNHLAKDQYDRHHTRRTHKAEGEQA